VVFLKENLFFRKKFFTQKRIFKVVLLLCVLSLSLLSFFFIDLNVYEKKENVNALHTAAESSDTVQWLKNSNFSSSDHWYTTFEGDTRDVNSNIDSEQANFIVVGDSGDVEVNNQTYPLEETTWSVVPNTDNVSYPQQYEINKEGCWVSHDWDEGSDQMARIEWQSEIEMPVNMSDYEITDASISSYVNATVNSNIDTPKDDDDGIGGEALTDNATSDYVRFYVIISSLDNSTSYEIAHNQTTNLGQNSPEIIYLYDTKMETYSKERLISFLTKVLKNHQKKFRLILGMRIWSEDNTSTDDDTWENLLIKNVTLSLSYKKKINQLSSVSWKQDATKIESLKTSPNDLIQIQKATLSFKYKIDKNWLDYISSQNSELRIIINNNQHPETIKLTKFIQDFQNVSFEIKDLIRNSINITIQVFLADNKRLNETIKISIDDVFLELTYKRIFSNYDTNLQIFLNGENKTKDPTKEVPLGKEVNLTIKYSDTNDNHVKDAEVRIKGSFISQVLIENRSLKQYTLIINGTENIPLGSNLLKLTANKSNYELKTVNIKLVLRKLKAEIKTTSGESKLETQVGKDVPLEIVINDLDFGGKIKNATVTYEWEFGTGVLEDTNNDGIYEGIIDNVPAGSYTVNITVFAGENYESESYQITVTGLSNEFLDPTLLIFIFTGIISSIGGYFIVYEKILKYAPLVRKIRKLRKRIRKEKKLKKFNLSSRDILVQNKFVKKKSIAYRPVEINKRQIRNIQSKKGVILLFMIITSCIFFPFLNFKRDDIEKIHLNDEQKNKDIKTSAQSSDTIQWLNNPCFNDTAEEFWYNKTGIDGDSSDISTSKKNNLANYEIRGDNENFTMNLNPPEESNWTENLNPEFPAFPVYPEDGSQESYGIDENGFWARHQWEDGNDADQTPSVHWDNNMIIENNMSDYIITSASLSILINATVDRNIDSPNDTVATYRTSPQRELDQWNTYDYARIYILISDQEKRFPNQVLFFQTPNNLGQYDETPHILEINDTILSAKEDILIDALNAVFLENDTSFTFTVGIDIFCEDNNGGYRDFDYWEDIRIKNLNFTFNYSRKVNQFTSASWKQNADEISVLKKDPSDILELNKVELNIRYTINKNWSKYTNSLNSEIRFLINNNPSPYSINLNDINQTHQERNIDITSLITGSINLTIQLYIADEFGLNESITISLDKVEIFISYTRIFSDYKTQSELLLNGINKTADPSMEIPVGRDINITFRYLDLNGVHLSDAQVGIEGDLLIADLIENKSLGQYSIVINKTQNLKIGLNILTITAQKEDYENQEIELRVTVRKIQTKTQTTTGEENVNINPGESIKLNISIWDLDSNATVKNALVTYNWENGEGVMEDPDGDGIYVATLEKVPAGSYNIEISVNIGEKYDTHDLELTLTAVSPEQNMFLFLLVLIIGLTSFIGLSSYFVVYQKILKYPPTVRKLRKLRKRIKNEKKLKPMKLKERNTLIQESLHEEQLKTDYKKSEKEINKSNVDEVLEDTRVVKLKSEKESSQNIKEKDQ
jgi:hypothetical protein